jgi:SAM-dependent methyltransferase
VTAFDELAIGYDAEFTESAVGRTLRALVRSRFEQAFQSSKRVLELGCGTGEDALDLASRGIEVVAVDASPRMIQVARRKAQARDSNPGTARVEFHCLSMEHLAPTLDGQAFDGVLSNFGAINCVPDLPVLVADVASRLRPGAPLVWVIMGPYVPWEWLWYLLRGQWAKAWRRLDPGGVSWRGLNVRYPSPSQLISVLRPHFAIRHVGPLGVVLPPTYAGAWLERHPRLLKALTALERMAQRRRVLACVSDHYIVEATRLHV